VYFVCVFLVERESKIERFTSLFYKRKILIRTS
jgi:hypothetical protein